MKQTEQIFSTLTFVYILPFWWYIASVRYLQQQEKSSINKTNLWRKKMDSFVSNQAPIIGANTTVTQQAATAPAMATAQQTPALGNIATDENALRFKEKAEAQTSKVISAIAGMKKLTNKKYYTYSAEQVNEMMSAIQSAMDEVKKEFLTDTTEKKKVFTFSS